MITGIEFLCDKDLSAGAQVTRAFQIGRGEDGLPLVVIRCATCGEVHEVEFVSAVNAEGPPEDDPAFSEWLLSSYNVLLAKWSAEGDAGRREMYRKQLDAVCRVARRRLGETEPFLEHRKEDDNDGLLGGSATDPR